MKYYFTALKRRKVALVETETKTTMESAVKPDEFVSPIINLM